MASYTPIDDKHAVIFGGEIVNTRSWRITGRGVRVDTIDGWIGGVEVRDERLPNSGWDGDLAMQSLLAGRSITLTGWVYGESWEDRESFKRELSRVLRAQSSEVLLRIPRYDQGGVYTDHILGLSGLAAFYPMNDTATSLMRDIGPNNLDGIYASSDVVLQQPSPVIAEEGEASVEFSGEIGSNGVVNFDALLNPVSVSVSAWVKVDDLSAIRCVVDSAASNEGYRLNVLTTGAVRWQIRNGSTTLNLDSDAGVVTAGEWVHLVATYNHATTTRRVYANGVQIANTGTGAMVPRASGGWRIAHNSANGERLVGNVASVSVFDRALTASEAAQLYARGVLAESPGIDGYERVLCRVVESLVFEDRDGPLLQEWQVVLRASDPRIYGDTLQSSNSQITDYDGDAPSPTITLAELSATGPGGPSSVFLDKVGPVLNIDTTSSGGAVIVDASKRDAYIVKPDLVSGMSEYLNPTWLWPCGAGSSSAVDFMGTASFNGTVNGGAANGAGISVPYNGGSTVFDGVDDSFSRTFQAGFLPTLGSMIFWYRSGTNDVRRIMDFSAGNSALGLRVEQSLANGVRAFVGSATGPQIGRADFPGQDVWRQIVLTFDPTGVRFYHDGIFEGSVRFPFAWPGSGTFYFGRSNAGVFWTGQLSSICMTPIVLSAERIREISGSLPAELSTAIAVTGAPVYRLNSGRVIQSVEGWPEVSREVGNTDSGIRYLPVASGDNIGSVQTFYRRARL